jgi:NAD(P)H-dependent FMN reductase
MPPRIESDAFIVASPEYNGSMPGMFKNLIDWTSHFRPQPFGGKHIGFARPAECVRSLTHAALCAAGAISHVPGVLPRTA